MEHVNYTSNKAEELRTKKMVFGMSAAFSSLGFLYCFALSFTKMLDSFLLHSTKNGKWDWTLRGFIKH